MGLDIYLYTAAQRANNEAHNKEEEEFYGGENWPLYEEKTDSDREEFRNSRQFPNYEHVTDVPSVRYGDDKLNNRRYLRSSYNGGGFNSAVPRLLGRGDTDYYSIFKGVINAPDEYEKVLTPDDVPALSVAAVRAFNISEELANLETPLNVTSVGPNPFSEMGPSLSDVAALAWAREEVEKAKGQATDFFGPWWSNGTGHFYGVTEPIEVVALVPGADWTGRPGSAVHVIYKGSAEAVHSYVQSAYIVGEFAEEAIALIEKDGSAFLSWSG